MRPLMDESRPLSAYAENQKICALKEENRELRMRARKLSGRNEVLGYSLFFSSFIFGIGSAYFADVGYGWWAGVLITLAVFSLFCAVFAGDFDGRIHEEEE